MFINFKILAHAFKVTKMLLPTSKIRNKWRPCYYLFKNLKKFYLRFISSKISKISSLASRIMKKCRFCTHIYYKTLLLASKIGLQNQ